MLITTCLCEHSVRVYLHVHTDCKSCCASQRRVSLAELASSFVVKLFDALSQVPTQPFYIIVLVNLSDYTFQSSGHHPWTTRGHYPYQQATNSRNVANSPKLVILKTQKMWENCFAYGHSSGYVMCTSEWMGMVTAVNYNQSMACC